MVLPMSDQIDVELIPLDSRLKLAYATPGSAGVDLPAMIDEPLTISPNERVRIGGGFKIHIKPRPGQKAMAVIAPRSGLGSRGLVVGNTIGVIDEDYQGEVGLVLFNSGQEPITIQPGDRIFQMLFVPVLQASFQVVDSFSASTERGEGGFGHSGA